MRWEGSRRMGEGKEMKERIKTRRHVREEEHKKTGIRVEGEIEKERENIREGEREERWWVRQQGG